MGGDPIKEPEQCGDRATRHEVQLARLWDKQGIIEAQQETLWRKFDDFREHVDRKLDLVTEKMDAQNTALKGLAWKVGLIATLLLGAGVGAKDAAQLMLKAITGGP